MSATQTKVTTTSSALTRGIRVTVESHYVPSHSSPAEKRYVFAYRVRIANEGHSTVQLRTRHWIIRHGDGRVEEVRGPGVVGEEPVLEPGAKYEYTSGCRLETPRGSMKGSYHFETKGGGGEFDADIAEFALELPFSLN